MQSIMGRAWASGGMWHGWVTTAYVHMKLQQQCMYTWNYNAVVCMYTNNYKPNSAAAEISAEGVGQAWCYFSQRLLFSFQDFNWDFSNKCTRLVANLSVLVQGETSLWIVCPRGIQSVEHLPQGLHLCGVLVTGSLLESDSHTKV